MADRLHVSLLANHTDLIPEIASWLYDEWGHTYPDGTPRWVEQALTERCQRHQLPLALVGFLQESPICTASLKIQEMDTHPHYEHWLGTVYTLPPYRRQGFGAQIVRAAEENAANLGLIRLYLYTRHSESFYARLGWQSIERPHYKGRPAVIMHKLLRYPQPMQA
ncbi:MAG: GNAT family N-acetyltransferase [Anaerolineales bacterium]|jgi:putative hydrolase of the HAD superfamily